jgi:thioredoxin 1
MTKVQVLDFYAEWCGPCKAMEPAIESLMTEYNVEGSGVEIKKVNVDSEHELTQKYNIKGIPTLIFLKDGEEASKVSGNHSKEKIAKMINEFLLV